MKKWTRIGGLTVVVAALAVGIALALGFRGDWAGAQGTEFIVNQDDGAGDPAPCNEPDFPNVTDIQTVVDAVSVHDDDTLILCPGTFPAGAGGAVEVDKELTIEGLASADRDDVVVQGTAGSHGFSIKADNVTIKHLKLVGGGTGGTDHGIDIAAAGPTTYDNAELSDLDITTWNQGISIMSSTDTTVGPNNDIHANHGGVFIVGSVLGGAGDRVLSNVIGPNSGLGMTLAQVDEAYVQGNTMSGNVAVQMVVSGRSNAFIWNNNIAVTATDSGIHIDSDTADTLVQIGGSADHTNNFTGSTAPGISYYVILECNSENTVDATFNYWNGINSNAGISAVVFNDEFDDPASGTADCPNPGGSTSSVVVHPFVTTLSTPSPTPTPSATATATPTATPSATRTVDLNPAGWHSFVWSGPSATDPTTALSCISGKFAIAYEIDPASGGFLRFVPGNSALSNITVVNKYDSLLVSINADGVTCEMPVAP